eukprot:CAMPEP_0206438760 /NCGR_PEP_ID=MMETSP0324_2-20121206/11824_1 /ASSEMBLY_ACC=CAM_ASM_000836 /TAXON_ID=2866 /ORGANISM="Crypthecodinium cohnii, Strain Seligo" /LENGTH=122 /DNA_ID=CAMNT_0053906285 /DNA_START=12 /DNA_END=382 /DNA_ORIENTATION=-
MQAVGGGVAELKTLKSPPDRKPRQHIGASRWDLDRHWRQVTALQRWRRRVRREGVAQHLGSMNAEVKGEAAREVAPRTCVVRGESTAGVHVKWPECPVTGLAALIVAPPGPSHTIGVGEGAR